MYVYAKNLADSWHLEKPMLQCKGKKKFPSGPASYFGIVSDEYRVTMQCIENKNVPDLFACVNLCWGKTIIHDHTWN